LAAPPARVVGLPISRNPEDQEGKMMVRRFLSRWCFIVVIFHICEVALADTPLRFEVECRVGVTFLHGEAVPVEITYVAREEDSLRLHRFLVPNGLEFTLRREGSKGPLSPIDTSVYRTEVELRDPDLPPKLKLHAGKPVVLVYDLLAMYGDLPSGKYVLSVRSVYPEKTFDRSFAVVMPTRHEVKEYDNGANMPPGMPDVERADLKCRMAIESFRLGEGPEKWQARLFSATCGRYLTAEVRNLGMHEEVKIGRAEKYQIAAAALVHGFRPLSLEVPAGTRIGVNGMDHRWRWWTVLKSKAGECLVVWDILTRRVDTVFGWSNREIAFHEASNYMDTPVLQFAVQDGPVITSLSPLPAQPIVLP
jgi:hypothetical protein